MGRFIGWIGPIAYLAVVGALTTLAVWFACYPATGYWAACLSLVFSGHASLAADASTPVTNDGADAMACMSIALLVTWCASILWFIWQAAVRHDGLEDERWTAHMLAVGLVSRIVLAPLAIFCTVSAAMTVGTALGSWSYHGSLWTTALWIEVIGIILVLPAALYQICGAARLAHRGLLGTTGLVWNVILALLPTLGFVAMCGLYVNGREELIAAHDRRVAANAVALTEGSEPQEPEPVEATPAQAEPIPDPRPDARQ